MTIDEEDLDELELRRAALASAAEKALRPSRHNLGPLAKSFLESTTRSSGKYLFLSFIYLFKQTWKRTAWYSYCQT